MRAVVSRVVKALCVGRGGIQVDMSPPLSCSPPPRVYQGQTRVGRERERVSNMTKCGK